VQHLKNIKYLTANWHPKQSLKNRPSRAGKSNLALLPFFVFDTKLLFRHSPLSRYPKSTCSLPLPCSVELSALSILPQISISMSLSSSNLESRKIPFSLLLAHFVCGVISTIIVRSFSDFENSTEALAFYGVYHRYAWNQVIHFFGVPGIFWSLAIFMAHVKLPGTIPVKWAKSVVPAVLLPDDLEIKLNYAIVLSVAYLLFYVTIDPLGGALYAPVLFVTYVLAMKLFNLDQNVASVEAGEGNPAPWYGTGKILKFAALVHFLSWFLQIQIGHNMIEGAQPASLQNLGAALSVAPLFAFYEGLWLIGINRDLKDRTVLLVNQYTKDICRAGEITMKACQNYD
jgi:2-hydroxy fatty acid dioxygenase